MLMRELREKLAVFPDDMPVVCWDGESHDSPEVVAGVVRDDTEWLYYGHGAREYAEDDANDDDRPAPPLTNVCVIKPDNV